LIAVLDACAALEIALNREDGRRLRIGLLGAERILAPDTFASEITSAFWKYSVHEELSGEECRKGVAFCLDIVDDWMETRSLCPEVLVESVNANHSVYDMFYLVLARRNHAVLLTRDRKMKTIAEEMNIKVF